MSNKFCSYRSLQVYLGTTLAFLSVQSHASGHTTVGEETVSDRSTNDQASLSLRKVEHASYASISELPAIEPTLPEVIPPEFHLTASLRKATPVSSQTVTPDRAVVEGSASDQAFLPSLHDPGFSRYAFMPTLPPIQPTFPEAAPETRLVVSLRERRVYVYQDDILRASYPVAIGRTGWETPTGSFEVLGMVENPGWTHPLTGQVVPPGPRNPLGERWIAFWTDGENLVGFHGTPERNSVGRAASHGCIRMLNEDVRTLYSMVEVGTTVIVQP
jgi:lipoprotein-anchoring transpeptidase ErfK/SrfK